MPYRELVAGRRVLHWGPLDVEISKSAVGFNLYPLMGAGFHFWSDHGLVSFGASLKVRRAA